MGWSHFNPINPIDHNVWQADGTLTHWPLWMGNGYVCLITPNNEVVTPVNEWPRATRRFHRQASVFPTRLEWRCIIQWFKGIKVILVPDITHPDNPPWTIPTRTVSTRTLPLRTVPNRTLSTCTHGIRNINNSLILSIYGDGEVSWEHESSMTFH